MTEDYTLRFGLDVKAQQDARARLSPEARERAFAREQINILLRYVTLYQNGRPVHPDSFAIVNAPERIIILEPENQG